MTRELVLQEPRDELLQRVRGERARRSFLSFVHLIKPEWERPLPWFHERLCAELQAWWESDEVYHLLLEMPPGHSKSWYAKLFVCWAFGRDPDLRVAYTGYGQDLAEEHSGDIQGVMLDESYGALFPSARLNTQRAVSDESRGAKRTKDEFHIVGREGRCKAVGIGGPLTGFRADLGIIDDPLKNAKDASSPTVREDQWRWYTRVLKTRKRPKRALKMLMLLTRWHLDDLAGRVQIREAKRWRRICFPALKEGAATAEDPRADGAALWDAVATRVELDELRESDPEGFGSLYQCRPVPEGGALIKATYLERRWESLDALLYAPGRWVQSWDCRNDGKDLKRGSQVAAHLYFEPAANPGDALLVDKRGGAWSPEETLAQFDALQLDPLWGRATVRIIEAKADGKMLLSLRQRRYPGMTPITPTEDKVTRLRAVLPFLAALNVLLPSAAPWLGQVLSDLTAFPAATHDDDVDALTQYLAWRWVPALDKGGPPPNPLERLRARQGLKR